MVKLHINQTEFVTQSKQTLHRGAQGMEQHNIKKKKEKISHLFLRQVQFVTILQARETEIKNPLWSGEALMKPHRQKVHQCLNTTNRHPEL